MLNSSWITASAQAAFRVFVPSERSPITWQTLPFTISYLIPFIYMAYLVRRPNTHLLRLIILPVVIVLALRASFGYIWMEPGMNVINPGVGFASAAFVCIGKALDYAFTKDGRKKLSEISAVEEDTPEESEEDALVLTEDVDDAHTSGNSFNHDPGALRLGGSFVPLWLEDAVDVICSMRGIGWDFGQGVHIPRETRSLERRPFLIQTSKTLLTYALIADVLDTGFKLVPGLGSPGGGTMFLPSLPPVYRYALSTAIHIATGSIFLVSFSMAYDLTTLFCVGLLDQAPSSWPPLFDNPWISQTLHEFWGKRWHQLLRRTFVIFGGIPGRFVAGKAGLVLGAFLASGLFHECAMYAGGIKWDSRIFLFFMTQGVAILLERVFSMVTGRRVGGWPGTVWVYFCIMVLGQPCVDSWHQRGLGGGFLFPAIISPIRHILLPIISHLAWRGYWTGSGHHC